MTVFARLLHLAPRALSQSASLAYAPRMEHRPEDSALMLRYRDGDVAAFEVLYRRHNDALYRYLLRLCRHHSTAEDVFQEVWMKVITGIRKRSAIFIRRMALR